MKNSISILMMALVAVSLFSCSNQSNASSESTDKTEAVASETSIIGSWKGEKNDQQGKGTFTYTFNEDGNGSATFNANGEEKVNENVTMKLNMTGDLTFNWENDSSTIKIKAINLKMNLAEKDISFKCKSPQEEELYNSQKSTIVNQVNNTFKDVNKLLESYNLDWKIKELSNDKLIVDEKGNIFEFTRVK